MSDSSTARFGVIEQLSSSRAYLSECDAVVAFVDHRVQGPAADLKLERSSVTFLPDMLLFRTTSTSLCLVVEGRDYG